MPVTERNVIRHELIGLWAEVLKSSNKSSVGISGKVVDETKNTLVIKQGEAEKRIQKMGSEFMFMLEGKNVKVSGNAIAARPEERIKSRIKKW